VETVLNLAFATTKNQVTVRTNHQYRIFEMYNLLIFSSCISN